MDLWLDRWTDERMDSDNGLFFAAQVKRSHAKLVTPITEFHCTREQHLVNEPLVYLTMKNYRQTI